MVSTLNRKAAMKPPSTISIRPKTVNEDEDFVDSGMSSEEDDETYRSEPSYSSSNSKLTHGQGKALAQFIESKDVGGIRALVDLPRGSQKVSSLLDRRKRTFGVRRTKFRRSFCKKVAHWKEYYRAGTYQERVLNFYKVPAFQPTAEDTEPLADTQPVKAPQPRQNTNSGTKTRPAIVTPEKHKPSINTELETKMANMNVGGPPGASK